MSNMLSYLVAFCRVTLIMVFALSLVGKIRNIQLFKRSIAEFKLVPAYLIPFFTYLILVVELIVATLGILGGNWLKYSFILAFLALGVFILAMGSVLARRIQTSCNCFGTSDKVISVWSMIRNTGFALCAIVGMLISIQGEVTSITSAITLPEWILLSLMSCVFLMILMNLDNLAEIPSELFSERK